MFLRVETFQSWTLPRSFDTAMLLPSGDQATMLALFTRVGNTASSLPVLASHSWTILSSRVEAMVRPSGDQAAEKTAKAHIPFLFVGSGVWPVQVAR